MSKVMVIGLGPEYNYPGNLKLWGKDNTKYASNHGASLIARTLIKMFDADYIDDFSKIDEYRQQYELCVIAFATHATDWRDVSIYSNFIEKLDIPTSLFSLGIQDYTTMTGNVGSIHPSLLKILDHVSNTTKYIGVRGFHTASLLYKEGYNNVIPIGCPTLYNGLNRNLKIEKAPYFNNPVNVFHRTVTDVSKKLIENTTLLGQDFLDEVVFTDNFMDDPLTQRERANYLSHQYGELGLSLIKSNGEFYKTFDAWFDRVGKADFVFGPRLHGCISGIIQGIPALMIARDIRVKEIAGFFKIPFVPYEKVNNQSLTELYDQLDYSDFNALYPQRYDNFISFLEESGVKRYLIKDEKAPGINFTFDDLQNHKVCLYQKINDINQRLSTLEEKNKPFSIRRAAKQIPYAKAIWRIVKY